MAIKKSTTKKIKKPSKKVTKKASKSKDILPPEDLKIPAKIINTTIHWEEAYPCLKETHKIKDKTYEIIRFLTNQITEEKAFETFLYEAIRSPTLPAFMRNNFKKIRKLIEKEIQYREKSLETLNKEQVEAFKLYFREPKYFEYYMNGEYFEHEMERVYMSYLKAYCSTGMYDSRARITNRKSRDLLNSKIQEAETTNG